MCAGAYLFSALSDARIGWQGVGVRDTRHETQKLCDVHVVFVVVVGRWFGDCVAVPLPMSVLCSGDNGSFWVLCDAAACRLPRAEVIFYIVVVVVVVAVVAAVPQSISGRLVAHRFQASVRCGRAVCVSLIRYVVFNSYTRFQCVSATSNFRTMSYL